METYKINVNGVSKQVTVDPGTPLLWVLREELKMTGTKYGCGIGACGACTVHLSGVATRSCVVPISLVGNRPVVTIEPWPLILLVAPCRTSGSLWTSCNADTARAGRS